MDLMNAAERARHLDWLTRIEHSALADRCLLMEVSLEAVRVDQRHADARIDALAGRVAALEAAITIAMERGSPLYTDDCGYSYCSWCGNFAGEPHSATCPWPALRAALPPPPAGEVTT